MSNIAWVVWFGSGALILFSAVYFFFDSRASTKRAAAGAKGELKRRPFSITFARLFGLLTVAVLAAALATGSVPMELGTAAFTLLGTIAGYLAGAKPTGSAAPAPAGPAAGTPGAPAAPPAPPADVDNLVL